MLLVTGQDQIVANFVSAGLGVRIHPPYTAMGWVAVDESGNWKLVSGAIFNDYHIASIEISFYGKLTRQCWRDILDYVFNQLKCLRLTARTKYSNVTVRQMLPKHGWVYEGTLKRFYGSAKSHGALVYRLDAEEAGKRYGKLSIPSSSL